MQVSVNDIGSLYFTFQEHMDDDAVVVYKLSDTGEIDFVNDECIGLELLNFNRQINRDNINTIELHGTEFKDDKFIFNVSVDGQMIRGQISLASLKE